MPPIKPIQHILPWQGASITGMIKRFRLIALHDDGRLSLVDIDLTRMEGVVTPITLTT